MNILVALFLKQMSQQITPYDIIFLNPDFDDFVLIAEKINDGLRIAIILENDLPREDIFFTTQFFPFTFLSIATRQIPCDDCRLFLQK